MLTIERAALTKRPAPKQPTEAYAERLATLNQMIADLQAAADARSSESDPEWCHVGDLDSAICSLRHAIAGLRRG